MSESHDRPANDRSEDGQARCEAMLAQLLAAMEVLHRRRRVRRRLIIAAAPVCAIALVTAIVLRPSGPAADRMVQGLGSVTRQPASTPIVSVVTLTDQQLLDELAAMNRPAGLVRTGSKAWLTRQVTDDALNPRESS